MRESSRVRPRRIKRKANAYDVMKMVAPTRIESSAYPARIKRKGNAYDIVNMVAPTRIELVSSV